MSKQTQLELEEKYVYESPDGGKTVYRRKIAGAGILRQRITPQEPPTYWQQLETYQSELEQLANSNPAIKEALDKLLVVLALTHK